MTQASELIAKFREFLAGGLPPEWTARDTLEAIEQEAELKTDLLSKGAFVYGANTAPGHLDSLRVASRPEREVDFIRGHEVGTSPYLAPRQALAVSFAKAQQLAQGASGISRETYLAVVDSVAQIDRAPLIPANSSYSCGDVVPAAHWAIGVLKDSDVFQRLGPGDGMALVNGSFVHVGVALESLLCIEEVWPVFLHAMRRAAIILHCDPDGAMLISSDSGREQEWLAFSLGDARILQHKSQARVSTRAIPWIIVALGRAANRFAETVERAMKDRSANPAFVLEKRQVVSQASFLAIDLQAGTADVLSALLMTATLISQHIESLCNDLQDRVLQNNDLASSERVAIKLSQIPKQHSAKLEEARRRYGVVPGLSSGETSHGVEDFWTGGLTSILALKEVVALVGDLAATSWALAGLSRDPINTSDLLDFRVPVGTGNSEGVSPFTIDAPNLWFAAK